MKTVKEKNCPCVVYELFHSHDISQKCSTPRAELIGLAIRQAKEGPKQQKSHLFKCPQTMQKDLLFCCKQFWETCFSSSDETHFSSL